MGLWKREIIGYDFAIVKRDGLQKPGDLISSADTVPALFGLLEPLVGETGEARTGDTVARLAEWL